MFAAAFTPLSQLVTPRSSVRVIRELAKVRRAEKNPLVQPAVDKRVHKVFTAARN